MEVSPPARAVSPTVGHPHNTLTRSTRAMPLSQLFTLLSPLGEAIQGRLAEVRAGAHGAAHGAGLLPLAAGALPPPAPPLPARAAGVQTEGTGPLPSEPCPAALPEAAGSASPSPPAQLLQAHGAQEGAEGAGGRAASPRAAAESEGYESQPVVLREGRARRGAGGAAALPLPLPLPHAMAPDLSPRPPLLQPPQGARFLRAAQAHLPSPAMDDSAPRGPPVCRPAVDQALKQQKQARLLGSGSGALVGSSGANPQSPAPPHLLRQAQGVRRELAAAAAGAAAAASRVDSGPGEGDGGEEEEEEEEGGGGAGAGAGRPAAGGGGRCAGRPWAHPPAAPASAPAAAQQLPPTAHTLSRWRRGQRRGRAEEAGQGGEPK